MRFVPGPSTRQEPRPPNIFNVLIQIDPAGRILREEIGR